MRSGKAAYTLTTGQKKPEVCKGVSHLDMWGKALCTKGITYAKALGKELGEKEEGKAVRMAAVLRKVGR